MAVAQFLEWLTCQFSRSWLEGGSQVLGWFTTELFDWYGTSVTPLMIFAPFGLLLFISVAVLKWVL